MTRRWILYLQKLNIHSIMIAKYLVWQEVFSFQLYKKGGGVSINLLFGETQSEV